MHHMGHKKWFRALTKDTSITAAAALAKIQKTTLMRQLDRDSIPAENVIALCRAFGENPCDGLVDTGYLDRVELEGAGVEEALNLATNAQMVHQIEKRLTEGEGEEYTRPAEVEVVEMHARSNSSEAVRRERYVALEAEAEPEMGDDDYGPGA